MKTTVFTLTEQHVKLARRMNVGWCYAEFGAPEIDPKRPYGNGCVENDMADILGISPDDKEDGEPVLSNEQRKHLCALHKEMQTALQIILTTGCFEPGVYESEPYVGDWHRK